MSEAVPLTIEEATRAFDEPTHPQDSKSDYRIIQDFEVRLQARDERMNRIEKKIDDNCADTSEVLDILRLGKSFFRLAGYVGAFLKWFTAIAAPVLAFWYMLKGGK